MKSVRDLFRLRHLICHFSHSCQEAPTHLANQGIIHHGCDLDLLIPPDGPPALASYPYPPYPPYACAASALDEEDAELEATGQPPTFLVLDDFFLSTTPE